VVCTTYHPRLVTIEICVVVASFLWFVIQVTRKWVLKSNHHLANHRRKQQLSAALVLCHAAATLPQCHCNTGVRHCCSGRPRWHCGEGTRKAGPQHQAQWHCNQLKAPWSNRNFEKLLFFDRSIAIPNTTCVLIAKVACLMLLTAQTIGSGQVQCGCRERSWNIACCMLHQWQQVQRGGMKNVLRLSITMCKSGSCRERTCFNVAICVQHWFRTGAA